MVSSYDPVSLVKLRYLGYVAGVGAASAANVVCSVHSLLTSPCIQLLYAYGWFFGTIHQSHQGFCNPQLAVHSYGHGML